MIRIWFYIALLLILAIIGLAIGSANDSLISFDFLIVKKDISVASVLVIGVSFGFILGVYSSCLLCIKLWYKEKVARLSLGKLKKQMQSAEKNDKQ
ncbi:MAG: LapA family protein [Succinivibrio sp.]